MRTILTLSQVQARDIVRTRLTDCFQTNQVTLEDHTLLTNTGTLVRTTDFVRTWDTHYKQTHQNRTKCISQSIQPPTHTDI